MTQTPPPADQPSTTAPPPATPQQQTTTPQDQPLYSAEDLSAAARSFGCYPWDVAGIFSIKGVDMMTIPDFEAALVEWQQQALPITEGA
jgi:hypothetical protein